MENILLLGLHQGDVQLVQLLLGNAQNGRSHFGGPDRFQMLGGNEFRLRQGFAWRQNACTRLTARLAAGSREVTQAQLDELHIALVKTEE